MGKINWGRVILGGLAGGFIVLVVDIFVNGVSVPPLNNFDDSLCSAQGSGANQSFSWTHPMVSTVVQLVKGTNIIQISGKVGVLGNNAGGSANLLRSSIIVTQ